MAFNWRAAANGLRTTSRAVSGARHCLAACLLLLFSAGAFGATAESPSFARVDEHDDGTPRALQLAIVSYSPAGDESTTVDLVSAIHIGDRGYYAGLNERFKAYDALLYELVAPPGTIVDAEAEHDGLVSGAQLMMTRFLGLSFQLDEIDYTAPNFVHADLSATELLASMAARDESMYTYFWRLIFASIRDYARDPLGLQDLQNLGSVVGSGQEPSFKVLLAYELMNTRQLQQIFGEDQDSAVIGARNARAIEVMGEQLDAGARRIGIFYGVGHMHDMEQRLLELGFERRATEWLDAWQLDDGADGGT